jgi:hypothetical protein
VKLLEMLKHLTCILMMVVAGADTYIYHTQALGANSTFEHTSKFVMEAADHLSIITGSASDIDVTVSYLDQTL